jgi:hypothetical protein
MMDTIRSCGVAIAAVAFIAAVSVAGWLFILGFIDAFRKTDRDEWTARDQDAIDALKNEDEQ